MNITGGIGPKIIFALAIVVWFNVFINRNRIDKKVYIVLMVALPIVLFFMLSFFLT